MGLEANVASFKRFYPGRIWSIRLYHDFEPKSAEHDFLCRLACRYAHLDLCHARRLPGNPTSNASDVFPMIWRFFSTLDPQVDVFLSRDLDSRFTRREIAAVNEFLDSGKAIHAMRDHPRHDVPLLGAAWGARLDRPEWRRFWRDVWSRMLNDPLANSSRETGYGADQDLVAKHVWPWAVQSNQTMQHDSFHCLDFPGSIGFPTKRLNATLNLVAAVALSRANAFKFRVECPSECRRRPEWIYC